jgi:uncharacterized membrane protein YqjE
MSQDAPGGLFDTAKSLLASLLDIVHTRIDLLATELEEERERLLAAWSMMLVALFCLGLGTLLLVFLVVVAFWDSYRIQVLAALTAVFLAGGAAALGLARSSLRSKPKLFAATLSELAKDRQQLTPRP